jgi:hypothetical protein
VQAIDEVDDENHQSRPQLRQQSYLKLNEESVNVEIETSVALGKTPVEEGEQIQTLDSLEKPID